MSEFAVLEVPLEFSDEYLPSFSPLRAALCEICGDGGYEEAQVMCENTGDDGSGCVLILTWNFLVFQPIAPLALESLSALHIT